MDTLCQRFGRVARGPGTEGVAILFAEDKYFDDAKEKARQAAEARQKAREEKASNAEKRKREQAETRAQKRARPSAPSPAEALRPITNNIDSESATTTIVQSGLATTRPSLSVHEALRIEYAQTEDKEKDTAHRNQTKSADGVPNIAPEMDNLINAATREFGCYRVPINAYYENDRRGMWHRLGISFGDRRCGVNSCLFSINP